MTQAKLIAPNGCIITFQKIYPPAPKTIFVNGLAPQLNPIIQMVAVVEREWEDPEPQEFNPPIK